MTIKTFKCEVTRIDKYEIEIDDSIINEEFMEDFRDGMYPFHTLEEHVEHLAQIQARFPAMSFIEGYGHVKRNGNFKAITKNDPICDGINIKIVDEDNFCDVDISSESLPISKLAESIEGLINERF